MTTPSGTRAGFRPALAGFAAGVTVATAVNAEHALIFLGRLVTAVAFGAIAAVILYVLVGTFRGEDQP